MSIKILEYVRIFWIHCILISIAYAYFLESIEGSETCSGSNPNGFLIGSTTGLTEM